MLIEILYKYYDLKIFFHYVKLSLAISNNLLALDTKIRHSFEITLRDDCSKALKSVKSLNKII